MSAVDRLLSLRLVVLVLQFAAHAILPTLIFRQFLLACEKRRWATAPRTGTRRGSSTCRPARHDARLGDSDGNSPARREGSRPSRPCVEFLYLGCRGGNSAPRGRRADCAECSTACSPRLHASATTSPRSIPRHCRSCRRGRSHSAEMP